MTTLSGTEFNKKCPNKEFSPYALRWVKEQTDELCKLAVSKNPFALEYVKNRTDELNKLAVSHNDGDTFAFYFPT